MKVDIYIKPGCVNNTKQVKLLKEKGHDVRIHDIFSTEWTEELLQMFFNHSSVNEWFNPTDPRIKSGEIAIENLNNDNIFQEMIKDPFLIKRPLLHAEGKYDFGFDGELAQVLTKDADTTGMLDCPNTKNPCDN